MFFEKFRQDFVRKSIGHVILWEIFDESFGIRNWNIANFSVLTHTRLVEHVRGNTWSQTSVTYSRYQDLKERDILHAIIENQHVLSMVLCQVTFYSRNI